MKQTVTLTGLIIVILFAAIVAGATLSGCSTAKPVTKKYVITSVVKQGSSSLVTIKGLRASYLLNSDTLKVNDTITITWVKKLKP